MTALHPSGPGRWRRRPSRSLTDRVSVGGRLRALITPMARIEAGETDCRLMARDELDIVVLLPAHRRRERRSGGDQSGERAHDDGRPHEPRPTCLPARVAGPRRAAGARAVARVDARWRRARASNHVSPESCGEDGSARFLRTSVEFLPVLDVQCSRGLRGYNVSNTASATARP